MKEKERMWRGSGGEGREVEGKWRRRNGGGRESGAKDVEEDEKKRDREREGARRGRKEVEIFTEAFLGEHAGSCDKAKAGE